jgi:transposase
MARYNTKMEIECLQIVRTLSVYTKQSTMLKNKLHGESVLGNPSEYLVRSIKRCLRHLHKKMRNLEGKLLFLVKEVHQYLLTCLNTIPGIGPKTAIMLVVLTGGFEPFNSASELFSYAGLTPVIRQSGSSVKGRPRISKIGTKS